MLMFRFHLSPLLVVKRRRPPPFSNGNGALSLEWSHMGAVSANTVHFCPPMSTWKQPLTSVVLQRTSVCLLLDVLQSAWSSGFFLSHRVSPRDRQPGRGLSGANVNPAVGAAHTGAAHSFILSHFRLRKHEECHSKRTWGKINRTRPSDKEDE